MVRLRLEITRVPGSYQTQNIDHAKRARLALLFLLPLDLSHRIWRDLAVISEKNS
jgi:hypothetical protein